MIRTTIRMTGLAALAGGNLVLLYAVYLLWFTGIETASAQRELQADWDGEVLAAPADVDPEPVVRDDVFDPGDRFAALWFERDGRRIVNGDVLHVLEGTSWDILRHGPGHYPTSDLPGGSGNLAIAGHRTTYGAPFWSLDELRAGDTVHVVDRHGQEWIYTVVTSDVVSPDDVWVIGDDPLGSGAPMVTLTTCHPRHSAAQRLVVWGELTDARFAASADPHLEETIDG